MISHWQSWLYVAAVLIPLGAFTIEALFGHWLKRFNAYVATGAISASCLLSLVGLASALPSLLGGHSAAGSAGAEVGAEARSGFVWTAQFDWVAIGEGLTVDGSTALESPTRLPALRIPLAIHIDALAVIMFAMITIIATLIHVYSIGYMAGDPRYPRFFTYLSLFCFSMLGLVASAQILMVFIFWELVGICSYLLIGFWFEERKNCEAANKAFLVNRVGDVGMLIGLGLIWSAFGTFSIAEINAGLSDLSLREPTLHRLTFESATSGSGSLTVQMADLEVGSGEAATTRTIPYGLLVLAGLGIFAGCVGKSAQFPLHTWLPDAMAGPTPVSALIHAATMVAAGVYLVGRFFPLFTHEVLLTVAYIGGITLFMAATIAVVQTDYKKVLAYSTVSQLGFMVLALGVGGWASGLFHLLTHAFFKALLFLCAGSVYHAVHTYEMPVLGGLWRRMPTTGLCMLIGTLAISGVPFFSGFYSKDAILSSAALFIHYHPGHLLLFVLPAFGAILTAFYMFRMWFLIFDGEPRGFAARQETGAEVEHGHFELGSDRMAHGHDHLVNPVEHARESPAIMTVPLMILAAFSVCIGWPWLLVWGTPVLEGMLQVAEPLETVEVGTAKWVAVGASMLILAVGIGLAIGYYSRWRIWNPKRMADRVGGLYRFCVRKWYIDELYDAVFVRPTLWLASRAIRFDQRYLDGLVNGSASLTRVTSRLSGFFDQFAVDGLVRLTGALTYLLGDWGRKIQTGRLRGYLGVLALGVVALFLGVFYWIQPR